MFGAEILPSAYNTHKGGGYGGHKGDDHYGIIEIYEGPCKGCGHKGGGYGGHKGGGYGGGHKGC